MHADFWHKRWAENQIGFHELGVNSLLAEHFERLDLRKGARVLVPLCGKSHDIEWLAGRGFEVVGVELSEIAVQSFFAERAQTPNVSKIGNIWSYRFDNISILLGDVFDIGASLVGDVDAVYDRAALVALPKQTRERYTTHLVGLTAGADQLVVTYEYDQSLMEGPPFSVSDKELAGHYDSRYTLQLLSSQKVESKLKGQCATEKAWLLKRK